VEKARIRVMCVDDCSRLAAAWTKLFSSQPDLEVVASLSSADRVVEMSRDRQADVVLMDLTMGGRDPLEATAELSRLNPDARVLICSGHSDPELVDRVIEAGAWGYVGKAENPSRIMDAIRRVAEGQTVIPGHAVRPAAKRPG
jgi:DNA-binding NarL/FixJ family response regulator